MLYCPMCERKRDTYEFPKFMQGLRGRVCKSCLHILDKYPIDHYMQKKFNNAGFQNESTKQIRDRKEMLAKDAGYIYHGKKV